MEKLRYWLTKRVLQRVASQSCPARIPRSGEAGKNIRCYSTVIKILEQHELLLKNIDKEKLIAHQWDKYKERYDEEVSIELHWIKPDDIEIRRYIGYFEVTYTSLWDFILNDSTGYMGLRAFLSRTRSSIAQYIFNKRTLELKKRHELLSYLIQHYGSLRAEFSLISLMFKVYSIYSVHHPDKDKLKRLLELQLDSFVKSGEVEKHNGNYRLTGKAILTLENFQLEKRRHRLAVIQQWLMITLTLLLALIGMVQAKIIVFPTIWEIR